MIVRNINSSLFSFSMFSSINNHDLPLEQLITDCMNYHPKKIVVLRSHTISQFYTIILIWQIVNDCLSFTHESTSFSLSLIVVTNKLWYQIFFPVTIVQSNSDATTRLCGELQLVKGCLHMNLPSLLHQSQLATWANYGTSYGTKLFLVFSLLSQTSFADMGDT